MYLLYLTLSYKKSHVNPMSWKKEFVQADLFVQKAGNKIVIDIALVLSIFWNSVKVQLINMTLIAGVVENACGCYQVILHPTSKWSNSTSQIA